MHRWPPGSHLVDDVTTPAIDFRSLRFYVQNLHKSRLRNIPSRRRKLFNTEIPQIRHSLVTRKGQKENSCHRTWTPWDLCVTQWIYATMIRCIPRLTLSLRVRVNRISMVMIAAVKRGTAGVNDAADIISLQHPRNTSKATRSLASTFWYQWTNRARWQSRTVHNASSISSRDMLTMYLRSVRGWKRRLLSRWKSRLSKKKTQPSSWTFWVNLR